MLLSRDSKILRVSASSKRILGFSSSSLEGSGLWDQMHKDDRERIYEILKNSILRYPRKYPVRIKRENGCFICCEARFQAKRTCSSYPEEIIVCSIRDMTEIKEEEKKREYSEKLLEASSLVSLRLLFPPTKNSISKVLHIATKTTGSDKASLFRICRKTKRSKAMGKLICERKNEKSKTDKHKEDLIPINKSWIDAWKQKESVKARLGSLPKREQGFLQERKDLSLLAAPVFAGKELWGFVCLEVEDDERKWKKPEESFIISLGCSMANFAKKETKNGT
jgi:PAS domain S-box-containing protein